MVLRSYREAKVSGEIGRITVSLEDVLYLTALVIWIVQIYIGKTIFADFYGGKLLTAIRYFCMLIFAAKIILSERTLRMRVLVTLFGLCAFFVIVQRHINTGMPLIQMVLLIYGAKDVSFKRICKVLLWTCVVLWIIPILVDRLGIYHKPQLWELRREREYLNYNYVSFAAIHFNNIVFCALYAYTDPDRRGRGGHLAEGREVSWILLLIFTAVEFWLYEVTDTSLPFLTAVIFMFLYVTVIKFRVPLFSDNRFTRFCAVAVFPVLAYITYYIAANYKKSRAFWQKLDKFTHSRVSLSNTGLKQYGVHIFGTQIVENTDTSKGTYFYIDSGYIKNLILYGIVVFAVIIAMYTVMTYAALIEHDTVLVIWLLTIAIYSMYNNNLLSPAENVSVLAFCYCMQLLSWHKRKKKSRQIAKRAIRRGNERFEPEVKSAES